MSSEQPNSQRVVLFLDRTHQSKLMVKMLRDLQVAFERHSTHYRDTEDDHVWIPSVAQRGWVIVSGDKGIENDGVNLKSVIESKAKVFILADSNSRGAEWAASLVMAYRKIVRLSLENSGPFYCRVNKGSDSHVGDIRFYEGGHPVPKLAPENEPKTTPVSH